VLEDATGRAELQRLGARSIPVLSRGDEFVFAQNIAQVVAFLKLDEKAGPVLSPGQLLARLDRFLAAALYLIPLMPDDRLDSEVPNRPRMYRRLAHHMFRIPEAFLEAAAGAYFSDKLAGTVTQPTEMASTAALAAYGSGVRERMQDWWAAQADKSCRQTVETYYGRQKLHEVLERTTWHVAQHDRQWMMLLEIAGIAFERPLGDADFADLPMPRQVWDD
jgi:hypothetical protein